MKSKQEYKFNQKLFLQTVKTLARLMREKKIPITTLKRIITIDFTDIKSITKKYNEQL